MSPSCTNVFSLCSHCCLYSHDGGGTETEHIIVRVCKGGALQFPLFPSIFSIAVNCAFISLLDQADRMHGRANGSSRGKLLDLLKHLTGHLPPGVSSIPPACFTAVEKLKQHYHELNAALRMMRSVHDVYYYSGMVEPLLVNTPHPL